MPASSVAEKCGRRPEKKAGKQQQRRAVAAASGAPAAAASEAPAAAAAEEEEVQLRPQLHQQLCALDVPAAAAPAAEASEPAAASRRRQTKAQRFEEALGEDPEEEAAAEAAEAEPRGVIYIGHVPKGFHEEQMKKYFSQFGTVTRLRLSRSKKNAKPKGYGWVEFEDEGVAKIVAETHDKYLMFGKQLVCHLVPRDKLHPALFRGCRRRMRNLSKLRFQTTKKVYNNRPKVLVDDEEVPQMTDRQATRRSRSNKKLRALLENMGVDYNPDEAGGLGPDPPKTKAAVADARLELTSRALEELGGGAPGAAAAEAPAEMAAADASARKKKKRQEADPTASGAGAAAKAADAAAAADGAAATDAASPKGRPKKKRRAA